MTRVPEPEPDADHEAKPRGHSVGARMEYASRVLLPARRFDEYVAVVRELLAEDVHYIDPVHELRSRDDVLTMLASYLPRAANEAFRFDLLVDEPHQAVWRWTMAITIRYSKAPFVIHGLVHAELGDGRIVRQREYYDPMESIGVIPFAGGLYRRLLRSA